MPVMARSKSADDPPDDPTLGGAIVDPADTSPRARFLRGEISAAELNEALADAPASTKAKGGLKPVTTDDV